MKLFRGLALFFSNRSKLKRLKSDGLTLENLKEIAQINEKYIEVKLPDGALIRIWPYGDKLRELESERPSFW